MRRRKPKKFLIILLILLLAGGGYYIYKKKSEEARITEIKKGWYIEVSNSFINVRDDASSTSIRLGKVKKGEVYKVLDFKDKKKDKECYWYHIEYKKDVQGYVCNPKGDKSRGKYLIDHNNPNDLYTPTIAYTENIYKVESIDKITYDHLTLWDDHEGYEVTHKVYHENEKCDEKSDGIEKYWIKYTITDKTGKSASTTQKIEFETKPEESKVLNFCKEFKKDE